MHRSAVEVSPAGLKSRVSQTGVYKNPLRELPDVHIPTPGDKNQVRLRW